MQPARLVSWLDSLRLVEELLSKFKTVWDAYYVPVASNGPTEVGQPNKKSVEVKKEVIGSDRAQI